MTVNELLTINKAYFLGVYPYKLVMVSLWVSLF